MKIIITIWIELTCDLAQQSPEYYDYPQISSSMTAIRN